MAEQSYSYLRTVTASASSDLNTGAVQRTLPLANSFTVHRVACAVTVAPDAASTITVKRETVPGVTTVTVGTFIVPSTAVAGDVIVAFLEGIGDNDLAAGECLSFTGDGVPTTGTAYFSMVGFEYVDAGQPNCRGNTTALLFSNTSKVRSGVGSYKQVVFTES